MSRTESGNLPKDVEWVRRSFLVPTRAIRSGDARRELFRNAAFKFTDTTLGGNFAINPPPQFTKFADPIVKSIHSASKGMGRYYSEAIDDNSFNIHMGFGVPAFNSLSRFFTTYYDPGMSSLARTGRGRGIFYALGRIGGFVVTAPFLVAIITGRLIRFSSGIPSGKYYYMKPTMPLYWAAVNQIANIIATNMRIAPVLLDPLNKLNEAEDPGYSQADIARYHEMLGEIYSKRGGIDVYAVANRSQRLNDRYYSRMIEAVEAAESNSALRERISAFINEDLGSVGSSEMVKLTNESEISIENYINAFESTGASEMDGGTSELGEESADGWWSGAAKFFMADVRDGSRWITFRVNNGGDSVSESVSNSTKEPSIKSTMNSMSSSSRDKRFSLAGGNIGDGLGARTIQSIIGAVGDIFAGGLDSMGASGLMQLSGTAFADIPDIWDDSSFNFPTSSYTIELRSPYGNKMARFQNLYIPLSMLLAAALPLSTGKNSYTAPFLCELFSRGRNQIRLGIIDSLEITRGVGNLAWTAEGAPLGIDVTFTVKDLSSVLHMPLRMGADLIEEDNAFNDYMATLGNLSLIDQVYPTRKLALAVSRRLTQLSTLRSPARWASIASATLPARIINSFTRVTARDSEINI